MSLADFEALVLTQQPAETNWVPVTDYSFAGRAIVEGQHPRRIKDVFEPTRVLDVGCGPERALTRLLREQGIQATAVDRVEVYGDYRLDIAEPLNILDIDLESDLVICREVLEHLTIRQIRQAVANLCVLSTRFVYGTTRFSSEHDLLRVETKDDLDPTHITIMAKDFLKLLFVLEGFRWRQDLADEMDWLGKQRTFVFERVSRD